MTIRSGDFKSPASTIPPLRQRVSILSCEGLLWGNPAQLKIRSGFGRVLPNTTQLDFRALLQPFAVIISSFSPGGIR